MNKFVGLLAAVLASSSSSAYGEAGITAPSVVDVTIHDCAGYPAVTPDVEIGPSRDSSSYKRVVPSKTQHPGIFVLHLLPDSNHFWIYVASGKCYTRIPVSVVAGHHRSILLFPTNTRILLASDLHWIAGCLPQGVGSVTLAMANYRPLEAATIDDGCYYFEFVVARPYVLRIGVSPGLVVDIPITVGGSAESGLTRNFSEDLFQKI